MAGDIRCLVREQPKDRLAHFAGLPDAAEWRLFGEATQVDLSRFAKQSPLGRVGQPSEVSQAVLWLLSDEASYVTGHTLSVDGGLAAR